MPGLSTNQVSERKFSNGQQAQILSISEDATCADILQRLQISPAQSNLVVIGGASKMTPESLQRLSTVFETVIAPLAERLHLVVLDGGTEAGVIQMMGRAKRATGGTFRLVGVAPRVKVRLPGEETNPELEGRKDLEPNHTDFCLVPGDRWGSESPWLARLASTLAGSHPSVTVMINGGQVALEDLVANLDTGRPAIVLSGSGRMADAIADAIHQRSSEIDPAVAEVVNTYYPAKLSLFDLTSPLSELNDYLERLLAYD